MTHSGEACGSCERRSLGVENDVVFEAVSETVPWLVLLQPANIAAAAMQRQRMMQVKVKVNFFFMMVSSFRFLMII